MENTALQLTLREMTQQATSPKFWAAMFAVVCILTVSAPFSTDLMFTSIQLFFYWGGIAVSTYFCATFVLMMTLRKLRQRGKPEIFSRVIASLVSAVAVAALVLFIIKNSTSAQAKRHRQGALLLIPLSVVNVTS